VFNGLFGAEAGELMHARGLADSGQEAIGERRTGVGQALLDTDERGGLNCRFKKSVGTSGGADGFKGDRHPLSGTIDGGEIFDSHMEESRFIGLERFNQGLLRQREQGLRESHPISAQETVQHGMGHGGIQERSRHRQEIIQGHKQESAGIDHDGFLGRSHCGVQGMGLVRGICDRVAVFPLTGGRSADAMLFGKGTRTRLGVSNLLPYGGRGASVLVKTNPHCNEPQPG
jgi:hypothetical protein